MLRIAGVSERDADLLLLEEFIASPEFCQFFLNEIGLNAGTYVFVEASRSVTDSTGESDLEVTFQEDDGSTFLLMIENKVGAGFQPRQADRYRERGENYVKQGKADRFSTVLLAPEAYFGGDSKGFDFRVNYESVKDWLEQSRLASGRRLYKISVLMSAIEKSSSGYQMVGDTAVSNFWRDYWRLVMDLAPEFGMEEPTPKPAGSTWISFPNVGLAKGASLYHKLNLGYFDLQFAAMGEDLVEMRRQFSEKILEDMRIVRVEKSAAIRLVVPKLRVADPLANQRDDVIAGMNAGKRLLAWALANLD